MDRRGTKQFNRARRGRRRGWESRTVGCTGGAAIFVARRNRGVITGGIRGNGDNAWLERWGP